MNCFILPQLILFESPQKKVPLLKGLPWLHNRISGMLDFFHASNVLVNLGIPDQLPVMVRFRPKRKEKKETKNQNQFLD